jgi:hypothetical protein
MKKQLLLGLIMILFIGTSLFAGIPDTKENEKPAVKSTNENKLSAEEMNHLTKRAETSNLNFTNKDAGTSKSNLVPAKQVVVEGRHRHGYILYGGGTVILIIILVLLLA